MTKGHANPLPVTLAQQIDYHISVSGFLLRTEPGLCAQLRIRPFPAQSGPLALGAAT